MRLHYLKLITPFRGLPADFEIDFTRPAKTDPIEPICLVGLNGSGKSNLMQALAQVFYYLFCINHPQAKDYPTFTQDRRFILRYELLITPDNILPTDDPAFVRTPTFRQIQFRREKVSSLPVVEYKNEPSTDEDWMTLKDIVLIDRMLPTYVIGYSSGQNELISNPFVQMDFLYYQDMREAVKGNRTQDLNRMFFLDYHINAMVVIINYINKLVDEPGGPLTKGVSSLRRGHVDVLDEVIGIDDVTSFSITMNLKVKTERSLEEVESLLNRAKSEGVGTLNMDFFARYVELPAKLLQFVQTLIRISTTLNDVTEELTTKRRIKLVMYFRVDNEMRKAFQGAFRGNFAEVFKSFYFLNLLNINLYSDAMQQKVLNGRYKVSINGFLPKYSTEEKVFHIDDIKLIKRGVEIDYKNLSDGEHQFINIAGTLMLLDEPGTLFLLDEPETHLNPEWRSLFIRTLNRMATNEADAGKGLVNNKDILLTTHSPFILSDCRRESIFVFNRDQHGNVQFNQPKINTYGASSQALLEQIFGKTTTISDMAGQKIDDMKKSSMGSQEEIDAIKDKAAGFGDSVEKFMLFVKLEKEAAKLKK
jgi:restriction system-associated AAA family ATPase